MVYHKSFLIQQITRLIKQDFTQIRVINLLIKKVMYFKQTTLQGNEQLYGRGLSSFFPLPITPRALFFFLPSPPTTQRGLCGGSSRCFKKRSYSILGSNHFTMRLTANNLIIYFEARKDLLVEHQPFLENEQSSLFIQEVPSKMSCRIITCLVLIVFTLLQAEGQFPRVCTFLTNLKNKKCCPIPKGFSAPCGSNGSRGT